MDKRAVSNALDEAATLMELGGDNPFRVRAYRNASRTVLGLSVDLAEAVEDGSILSVKGIGKNIAEHIGELLASERPPFLAELRSRFPAGVLEMLRIPGLGPRKIRVLMDKLEVGSVGELEYVCRENRLLDLPGFGKKTQENILKGIAGLTAYAGRYLAVNVQREADVIVGALHSAKGAVKVSVAGSLRRRKEVVKDMDLLASGDAEGLMDAVASHPLVDEVTARGDTKLAARLGSGVNLDLRVVPDHSFPYALQHFTGSKEHNVRLREIAIRKKWKLNEWGLFDGDRMLAGKEEEVIYRKLDLPFIPPEQREDRGEFDAAAIKPLLDLEDIRGDSHTHPTARDGTADAETMAHAAADAGYEYLAITDHSKSSTVAGGLSIDRMWRQIEAIRRLNEHLDTITLLVGCECDILADGSLDYPDPVLAACDFVVASVHSAMRQERKKITARVLKALENPYVCVLGHPTARLINRREPLDLDMSAVVAKAAETGTALELNASWQRLDLNDRHLRMACEAGVKISINTDAHSTVQFDQMKFGIATARRGWVRAEDVINTMPLPNLRKWIAQKRKR